ncbi:S-type anion channel SLAH3 [Porphyridium purpureum]|uniref:S-type anion channel SLAH3 n=1 Tax=Porphyridium purpureum TaxID=35688 RepID=A0A5J4Z3A2_PORPP|nr:S-type anion channel SLAH3 [Porphyridium purpureum]|eukprot:POR4253..scf295_1
MSFLNGTTLAELRANASEVSGVPAQHVNDAADAGRPYEGQEQPNTDAPASESIAEVPNVATSRKKMSMLCADCSRGARALNDALVNAVGSRCCVGASTSRLGEAEASGECFHCSGCKQIVSTGNGVLYEDEWSKIEATECKEEKSRQGRQETGHVHTQEDVARGLSPEELSTVQLGTCKTLLVQSHVGHFGPALGWSALTSLWKTLSTGFAWLNPPAQISEVMWFVTAILLVGFSAMYIARIVTFPAGFRSDLKDYRRVNFFAAPLIATTNLLLTVPQFMHADKTALRVMFYLCVTYQTLLSLFIYGEWLFGATNMFAHVHPLYQMAVIGYFVLATLGSRLGELSAAMFCFSVGLLFLAVVFFTLFQRLAERYIHHAQLVGPTMFLFLAPPGAAAVATWSIVISHGEEPSSSGSYFFGDFFFYTDVFIYMLLLRLLPQFWTNKFTIVWWAYVFPMLTASIAATHFAIKEDSIFWNIVAIVMVVFGTLACLIISTVTVYFILKRCIPDDEESVAVCKAVQVKKARAQASRLHV